MSTWVKARQGSLSVRLAGQLLSHGVGGLENDLSSAVFAHCKTQWRLFGLFGSVTLRIRILSRTMALEIVHSIARKVSSSTRPFWQWNGLFYGHYPLHRITQITIAPSVDKG